MEPIVVEVTRGAIVEARHVVHAVVVREGRIEVAAGDPALVALLRSSAKPIQALPLARARPDLDDEQLALACASHLAAPEQVAIVRRLLAAAPATEDELECGPDPTPIEHNCSGKHAGFLALCRAEGWPTPGYRAAEHPCQQLMLREIAAAAEVDPVSIPAAVDGCGVQTFALSLERAAHAFSRLRSLEGGARIVGAMLAHPNLLRGPVATDVRLMKALPDWVAKGGAEGLLCAASPDGLGVCLKVSDGAFRALAPALVRVLGLVGVETGDLGGVEIRNSHGERVGELRVAK